MKKHKKKMQESPEMMQFYRVLAITHANAIHRVMFGSKTGGGGKSAESIIKRAVQETEHLIEAQRLSHPCPPGTIWDEVIGACVKV